MDIALALDRGKDLVIVKESHPVFSPDGKFWVVKTPQNGKSFFFDSDGKRYGPYSKEANPLIILEGKKWIISNDKEKNIDVFEMAWYFGSDADKWVALYRNAKNEYYLLSSEGRKSGTFETGFDVTFSPDGNQWVASAKKADKFYILNDEGKKFGPYKSIDRIKFTSDSKSWFVKIEKKEEQFYLLTGEGKEFGPYPDYSFYRTENNGIGVITTKSVDGKEFLKFGEGKEIGPFLSVGPITFSPDEKSWFAAVKKPDRKWYLLFSGGKEIGPVADEFNFPNSDYSSCASDISRFLFKGSNSESYEGGAFEYYESSKTKNVNLIITGSESPYIRWVRLIGRDIYLYRISWNRVGIK